MHWSDLKTRLCSDLCCIHKHTQFVKVQRACPTGARPRDLIGPRTLCSMLTCVLDVCCLGQLVLNMCVLFALDSNSRLQCSDSCWRNCSFPACTEAHLRSLSNLAHRRRLPACHQHIPNRLLSCARRFKLSSASDSHYGGLVSNKQRRTSPARQPGKVLYVSHQVSTGVGDVQES